MTSGPSNESRSRRAIGIAIAIMIVAGSSRAAAPVVDYLFPPGGRQGTSVSVTAGGKVDKAPTQVWTDHPGLKAQPAAAGGSFTLQIDKDAPPGAHLLRLYNAEGASALRVFVVGADPDLAEAEPNDELAKAQPVAALPVTVNGRLEKSGDVDSYSVKLEAGQWLSAAVLSRRLGAPVDPMLHLYDAASGDELAFAHDGLGLDPLLVFRAEKAYVVRVSAFPFPPAADVKLTGGAADVYRLRLSGGAPVRYAFPAGVRRGTKARVALFDWAGEPSSFEVDATKAGDEVSIKIPAAGADGALALAVGDGPELTEPEAESAASGSPARPAAPFAVTGRLEHEGEEDAIAFVAKKGERLTASARAVALASEMDPVLRLEDESGKVLAADDDGAGPPGGDARLQWEAPADGVYRAVVADLSRRAGPGHVYRLSVSTQGPSAAVATVDADEYRVAPGKPATVKVTVARPAGDSRSLVTVATGLPAGVAATSADVPEKGGEVSITLTAAADAKPASGPLRVMLLAADRDRPGATAAACSLRKDNGQELVERSESLWLTVLPVHSAEPKPGDAPKAK